MSVMQHNSECFYVCNPDYTSVHENMILTECVPSIWLIIINSKNDNITAIVKTKHYLLSVYNAC